MTDMDLTDSTVRLHLQDWGHVSWRHASTRYQGRARKKGLRREQQILTPQGLVEQLSISYAHI